MKWSTHISEFENLLPNTGLQVEKALQLYDDLIPQNRGKIVFLAGQRGSGRSEVLKAISETFPEKYKNIQVIFGKFTDGKYLEISAKSGGFSRNADLVGNLLSFLAKLVGLKTGLPIDLILESAASFFDFIGQLLQTSGSVKSALDDINENPPNIAELPNAVKKLLRAAAQDSPIICLFDDFDEARFEWHEFLDGFAEELGVNLPIVFFVSIKGSSDIGEHQAGETNLEMVVRRALKRGLAEWWHLRPMTGEEIAEWIDAEIEPGMVDQIHEATGGISRWVVWLWREWKTKELIVFNEILRRWEWSKDKIPSLEIFNDILRDIIASLLNTNNLRTINQARDLLAVASLEGTTFTAEALALATNQSTDDVINYLDDYFVQEENNPGGILLEEGFRIFEVQPGVRRNVFLYSFVSDWHWHILNRFAITKEEKKKNSAELITALQITYEENEILIARSLARLYENIDNKQRSKHFETMASYSNSREILFEQAQRIISIPINKWNQFQSYQLAKFLSDIGVLVKNSNSFEETVKIFEYAQELAFQSNDIHIGETPAFESGRLYKDLGQLEKAKKFSKKSYDISEKVNCKVAGIKALFLMAEIARAQHDYNDAKDKATRALEIAEKNGYRKGQALCLWLLAEIALSQEEGDNARNKAVEALEISQEDQDKNQELLTLSCLAKIALFQKNCNEAKDIALKALEGYTEINDKWHMAVILHTLANIADEQQDYDDAKDKATRALQLYEVIGGISNTLGILHLLSRIALSQNNYDEARDKALKIMHLNKEVGDKVQEIKSLYVLANAAFFQKDYEEAKDHTLEGLQLFEKVNDKKSKYEFLHLLAEIVLLQGDYNTAESKARQALDICDEIGDAGYRNLILRTIEYSQALREHLTS